MSQISVATPARVLSPDAVAPREVDGCDVRSFVAPGGGSSGITAVRIDVPTEGMWTIDLPASDTIGVVFAGCGELRAGEVSRQLQRGSSFYVPAGAPVALTARSSADGLSVYLWQAAPPPGHRGGVGRVHVSSLDDDTTSFRSQLSPTDADGTVVAGARMNFVHWPGTGVPSLSLHAATYEPGETFPVHAHAAGEELFIAFEGTGECFLNGVWQPMRAGDVLYAPPGHPHGVRKLLSDAGRFVTTGGPCPFDAELYRRAGFPLDAIGDVVAEGSMGR